MNVRAALAIALGLALFAWLVVSNDVGAILALIASAGWGLLLVVALHLPQTALSAIGWGRLIDGRAAFTRLFVLRWVRESVNALLPVAQIGGEVVRARLLARNGVALAQSAASVAVDLSAEILAQALFTLAGVLMLLAEPHGAGSEAIAWASAASVALLAILFLASQRLGLFRLVETLLSRRAADGRWGVDIAGLHQRVSALYRQPKRVARSAGWHLASWCAGVAETYAALAILGLSPDWREALVIEALGQAIRAAGFLVPGAIGIQEGGFVLIGALYGIDAEQALALSLVRRIRELALGLPGLAVWHHLERTTRKEALP